MSWRIVLLLNSVEEFVVHPSCLLVKSSRPKVFSLERCCLWIQFILFTILISSMTVINYLDICRNFSLCIKFQIY